MNTEIRNATIVITEDCSFQDLTFTDCVFMGRAIFDAGPGHGNFLDRNYFDDASVEVDTEGVPTITMDRCLIQECRIFNACMSKETFSLVMQNGGALV